MSLGKRFYSTEKATLDHDLVNLYRRRIEDFKLAILDAAEAGIDPPVFQEVDWLYAIWMSNSKKELAAYKFIYDDFGSWLRHNHLDSTFDHNYSKWGGESSTALRITINRYTDFEKVNAEEPYDWLSAIKNRQS
jgi:hypothetical protein